MSRRARRWRAASLPLRVAPVVLLVAVVGVVAGFVVDRGTTGSPARRAVQVRPRKSQRATPSKHSTGRASGRTPRARPVLRVVSATPTNGSKAIPASAPIILTFSAPLVRGTALPTLSPVSPGAWTISGATMTFTPSIPFMPLARISVTVGAGNGGPRGVSGAAMTSPATVSFRTEDGSIVRLDQLLSVLDYSPLSWASSGPPIAAGDVAAQVTALYSPPPGAFAWRQQTWPTELTGLWAPGSYNVMARGLVMSFQADHGLFPTGAIGPGLWATLLRAVASNDVNTGGYDYALASKTPPESLTIWHDGTVVVRAPANTGIAASPTPDGIFPVDTRLRNQVMRGTNPNGSHYADPVQFVAYFHRSDAVHYLGRADYGIPQSLGCIELSLADAARAWPFLAYGTLVEVVN